MITIKELYQQEKDKLKALHEGWSDFDMFKVGYEAGKAASDDKADAERYRYLKTDSNMQFNVYNRLEIDEIDDAIDTAMGGEK